MLESIPGPELVEAVARVASKQFVEGSHGAAVEAADRALALAEELALVVPGGALATRGFTRCKLGDLDGLTDAERALELLIAAGQGRDAAVVQHNLACMRSYLEGPAAAVAGLEEARAFSTTRGLVEQVSIHIASSVVFLVGNGRLDEALARADSILPLLRESGNRLFEHVVLAGQAVAFDERGEDALDPAEQALEIARGSGHAAHFACAAWGTAPALISAGRIDEAKELLAEVADAAGHDHPDYGHYLARLARAAHALDDDDLLARLAAGVPETLPTQRHALAVVRAIQAERAGEHAEAAALYAAAADRWERFTEVLEQAHALLGQGRCLTAAGNPGPDQPLRRARALFDQIGARRRVDECDSLIAQASKLTS